MHGEEKIKWLCSNYGTMWQLFEKEQLFKTFDIFWAAFGHPMSNYSGNFEQIVERATISDLMKGSQTFLATPYVVDPKQSLRKKKF